LRPDFIFFLTHALNFVFFLPLHIRAAVPSFMNFDTCPLNMSVYAL